MQFDLAKAVASQGKALGPHPAFMDRSVPVAVYAPGAPREDAVISQREASRHTDAYGGTQAIDWVYDCIGMYADGAATAKYRLEKPDGTRLVRHKTPGTPPEYEVGPQGLYDLLDKPNPFMLYDELMSLLVIDLMLVGNAYWFKWRTTSNGQPLALYRLAPSHVKIKPGPYGPKAYEYQPPGVKTKLEIDPVNIIHFRRPNPNNSFYGMGVIQGAGRAMDLELAITDTMAAYYENKADPSLIIQSERRMPRDVFNKLRAQLRARAAGSNRAGEMLVLESGLKATTLDVSAADALFEQLARMSRNRIFSKFRISPRLFGLMDESGGPDKVSDLRRDFDNSTLRPYLQRLSGQITAGLVAAWNLNYVIDHQSYLPPDEAVKVAGEIAKAPGIKVREVRKQYAQFGISESTGDDNIDNFVLNMPTPEMDENGQIVDPVTGKKIGNVGADRPLPGEPGRPPKGENTKGFGVAKAGKKSLEDLMRELEGKALAPDGANISIGNRLEGERRPDDLFEAARHNDINSAVSFIERGLGEAAQELELALQGHVEGKALKTSDIVQRINRSDAWVKFRERISDVLEEGARRAAASGALHSGLNPEEDIDYDALAKSVVHRPEGVRSILSTIRNRIVKRVKEVREADGERADFQTTIKETLEQWSTNQANLIAETEAVNAYNEATLTMAELSGIGDVFVTDGNDHDEPCVEANGSVWTVEHARENRLEHPRCRRAFIPLSIETVA
jgi:HK97 family phage portal protein